MAVRVFASRGRVRSGDHGLTVPDGAQSASYEDESLIHGNSTATSPDLTRAGLGEVRHAVQRHLDVRAVPANARGVVVVHCAPGTRETEHTRGSARGEIAPVRASGRNASRTREPEERERAPVEDGRATSAPRSFRSDSKVLMSCATCECH